MWRGASGPGLVAGQTLPSGLVLPSPTFTGTVTASQVTGIPVVLAKWGVPVILASSGSMANNGAVSGMTALARTYSGGAWLYLPAGAVAAGVPAAPAFLWFVASSSTAGTVYNSTWDGTGIPPLGTATAFATTGPGAFTGIATGEIVVATITVPANALGPNGSIRGEFSIANNGAAGNKLYKIRFGGGAGTAYFAATATTTAAGTGFVRIANSGVTNAQAGGGMAQNGAAAVIGSAGTVYGAVDTTASTTIVVSLEKATATNHAVWEDATFYLAYGA